MASTSEATAPVADLTPSQTIDSGSQKKKPRRKRGGKNPTIRKAQQGTDHAETMLADQQGGDDQKSAGRDDRKPPSRRKRNGRKKQNNNKGESERGGASAGKKQRARGSNRGRKRYPWRKHIPAGSVDPITLDSLRSLPYPPFALVAEEPYDPVREWPIPDTGEEESRMAVVDETDEERERRIIQEQWGDKLKISDSSTQESEKQPTESVSRNKTKRHYHLFDGRALAYYMVSQLQFIDPLNRRDLTRDELVNLDHYLRRHGFVNLNVTEAFDAKGVTISSSGAAGQTAAGRAAIMQQEANVLLNALFGGVSVAQTPSSATSTLRMQYQAHEESQQQNARGLEESHQSRPFEEENDGIYGGGGLLVIDDDANPGLRGTAPEFVPSSVRAPNTLWSASHITATHGHSTSVRQHDFPSLSDTTPKQPPTESQPQQQQPPPKKPPPVASKTLSRISSAVKKTDPEELQRQWEAREEARRRAMMSNLSFGSQPEAFSSTSQEQVPATITTMGTTDASAAPSEAQLERNKALAEALGVAPSTVRQQQSLMSGWARPTDRKIEFDEFGNELNMTIYPDALILEARERMGPLMKLEKKWKTFLADDASASLPLNPMDRPMRTFVHSYSDFWKLQTESFDPEPKRYIHCVKLRDTAAPYPLLSDAARNWRGPQSTTGMLLLSDHPVQQTPGQSTRGRDIPAAPQRDPLPLKPRTVGAEREVVPSSSSGGTRAMAIGGAPTRTMTEPDGTNSRFESLSSGRERPKLELQKRTLPLNLPPFQPPQKGFEVSEELLKRKQKMEEKAKKEQEEIEMRQRALEAAFASDDEESYESSEWEEKEQEYVSDEEEEE